MRDPRGVGFNKHRGKWHKPPPPPCPTPGNYGWTYLYDHPETGRPVYQLGEYKLMPVDVRNGHHFLQYRDEEPWELVGWRLLEITIEAGSGIPFDGQQASQPDELTLADSYGLEARG